MRQLHNAIGVARATGKPLAGLRHLLYVTRDTQVLAACFAAVLVLWWVL